MKSPPERVTATRVAGVVVFVVFAGLGFLPLFGGFGYEHSLATGLVLPLITVVSVAWGVARGTVASTPSLAVLFGIRTAIRFVVLDAFTALLHGARVGFCSPLADFTFFMLSPVPGVVLAGAWGGALGIVLRKTARKRLWAVVLGTAIPLGSALVAFGRFVGSPMIFAFDPFVGFFSGTIYDTVIDGGPALLSFRVGTTMTVLALVTGSSLVGNGNWLARRRSGFSSATDVTLRARVAAFGTSLALSVGIAMNGVALGHVSTSSSIAKELGGRIEGPRCSVVHAKDVRPELQKLLLADCEADLRSVEAALGARGPERITVFVFPDAATKKRLMGAANTYIAKPWRHEVYVQDAVYPHPVLGHELAHVVAGAFGRGPFRVAGPAWGLLPDPGLIEGVAVFASPHDDELTTREWSRAMLDLGILPPMKSVFSLAFLGGASPTSYTVAGAFVAFLADTYGVEKVRAWYGGAPVEGTFGKDLDALDSEFRARLASEPLPEGALAYAKAKFDRPGLFARHCPHVVDAIRGEADGCRDARRPDLALPLYDRGLALEPTNPSLVFGRALVLARDEATRAAGEATFRALVADPKSPKTLVDKAEEALADAALLSGDVDRAKATYLALAAGSLDEAFARTQEVKAKAAEDAAARKAIVARLVGSKERSPDSEVALGEVAAWATATDDALAHYLWGKSLVARGFWSEGAAHLDRASAKGTLSPRIERELFRDRSVAACALGDDVARDALLARLRSDRSPFRPGVARSHGRGDAAERFVLRCGLR
ncbi:MAG: hypothetical protein U0169_05765 [Polyangiaceae bacterium]